MMNLLQLSSEKEDRSPNSWIWIFGKGFRKKLNRILEEIIKKKNIKKADLMYEILNELECSIGPLNRFIWGKEDKIPIILLEKILNYSTFKKNHINYFVKNIISISTSRQKEITIPKKLNPDIAEIMGAYAADGNITVLVRIYSRKKEDLIRILKINDLRLKVQKDRDKFFIRTSKISVDQLENIKNNFNIFYSFTYLFEIVDADKVAVEYIANKIKKLFEIEGNIQKKKEAWSLRIYNKIFVRYFRLLGFNYGRKTETVREPLIIKKNPLNIRCAFARGVLTFDGSVKYEGNIRISLKSEKLIEDLQDINRQLRIKDSFSKNKKISTLTIDKNDNNTLSLFVPKTKKWHRLKDILEGFNIKVKSIEEAKNRLYEAYDKYNRGSVNFADIINYLQNNKAFRTDNIENVFKKNTAFYTKLRMLKQMKIINTENILLRKNNGIFKEKFKVCKLNKNIAKWRLPNY